MRSLIAKIENDQIEKGLQLRNEDPVSPIENQIWINTVTKKTSYYFNDVVEELSQGFEDGNDPFGVIELVGSNIDWNIGKIFKIENTSGIFNITMSNQINGESRYLMLVSASLTPTSVTFDSSINIDLNDNYNIPGGEGLVIEFNRINSIDYAKIIFNGAIAPFPSGSSGDLVINNGQTFTIPAGSVLDYENITINSGGILDITGTSANPVVLGVNNNLIINGTIRGTNLNVASGNWSTITPNGEDITFEIQGRSGGGSRGDASLTGHGSGGNGGNGGGGGQGGGQGGIGGIGGIGGTNGGGSRDGYGYGGGGNSTLGNGNNGGNGASPGGGNGGSGGGSGGGGGGFGSGFQRGGGGGGGGGHRGRHGRALYIYCRGNITGSGTINLNGQNGFNGGNGGGSSGSAGGGQQGGGGAGGSGGNLWIRSQSFDVSYTISNGNGGTGFSSGQSGLSGTFDFEQI